MSRARAGIQDAPLAGHRLCAALLNLLRDYRRDAIEMACVEECCSIPQLLRAVATRSRLAFPTAQEVDVALAGHIEAVAVPADECACRSG